MNAQYQKKLPFDISSIFSIRNEIEFNTLALKIFEYQLTTNKVYADYCRLLSRFDKKITHYTEIPFLPIEFFKTHSVKSSSYDPQVTFTSSGTTQTQLSKHYIKDLSIYETSFIKGFEMRYGPIEDFVVLGLLPSYLEREGSSLVYMVDRFIQLSKHIESGFFLNDLAALNERIHKSAGKKTLLIGVTYALLDFGETFRPNLSNCIIMETGGMKGKRKEMIKSDLHDKLQRYFSNPVIHSEYGMTELLSQAYSVGLDFKCPPWMKAITRSYSDPFEIISNKTGGLNIIDLANIYSCSFIATQDLGRIQNNSFQVLGRFDNTDIRGCNLLVQ